MDDLDYGAPPEIQEARDRFYSAAEAEGPQRRSSLQAKKFLALDQWADEIKQQRQGAVAVQGQPSQPPRPCLTLDCVSEPWQQTINAIQAADFSVKVSPVGVDSSDKTAEVLTGLIRKIQNDAREDDPMGWAGADASGCGIGWALVLSRYEKGHKGEPTDDQELYICRIPNCFSVYTDPASVKRNKSDMRFAFVMHDMATSEFKRQYPKADLKGLEDFRAEGDDRDKDWVTETTIRVGSYWHLEEEDGKTVVYCDTITAVERLDRQTWGGKTIPLIFVAGREMNVDGEAIYFGITQPAIGPQQMVNFTFSGAAESLALAPKTPFIVAEGQTEGYDQIWQNANRYNYAYLPYKPTSLNGEPVPPPMRTQASQDIQAWASVMTMSLDAVRRTTSFDPALGQMPGRQMSADAIEALQQQSVKGLSGYLDGMRRAYLRLGEILLEAIPVYYDRPGRVVQILSLENTAKPAMLNMAHYMGPNNQPQPLQPGQPPPPTANADHFDLQSGCYNCVVEVGKSSATRREEGVAALGDLAKTVPELVPKFADLWVSEMDFPGAQAVADRLAPPGVGPNQLPPQAQAMLQQLQQENSMLKQQIATGMPKIQSQMEIAKLKADTDIQKAQIAAAATMTVGQWKSDAENARSFVEAFEARLAHEEGFRFHIAETLASAALAAQAHTHTMTEKVADQTHEAALTGLSHAHEAAQSQLEADRQEKQLQMQAALQPQNLTGGGAQSDTTGQ